MKIWLFSYSEILTRESNPRLLGYYEYLQKQGDEPCFCFLKGSSSIDTPYDYKVASSISQWWLFRFMVFYFDILLFKPVDTIYFYSPNSLFTGLYLVCALRGVKIVVEKTELDSIKPRENWKDRINKILYRLDEWIFPLFADRILVISDKLEEHYKESTHPFVVKIGAFIPYHSLNAPTDQPKQNSDQHPFTIGYLGSFGLKDDMETLLKAFGAVKARYPETQLKLIGKIPFEWSDVRQTEGIICTEEIKSERIDQELRSCNVLVAIRKDVPYSHYGFPSKLAEYLAAKTPVVCTPSSDIPKLLSHKEHVYIVPFENHKALSEGIIWVKENSDESMMMAQSGYQWALSNWHPDHVLSAWYSAVTS